MKSQNLPVGWQFHSKSAVVIATLRLKSKECMYKLRLFIKEVDSS